MSKKERRTEIRGGESPSAALGSLFRFSATEEDLTLGTHKERRLDQVNSKIPPSRHLSALTPDEAKELAIKGQLGWTEVPAKQIW